MYRTENKGKADPSVSGVNALLRGFRYPRSVLGCTGHFERANLAPGSAGPPALSTLAVLTRKRWWTWRGSNPVHSLIIRNLLNLRNRRNAKSNKNAGSGYTAGTRTAARGPDSCGGFRWKGCPAANDCARYPTGHSPLVTALLLASDFLLLTSALATRHLSLVPFLEAFKHPHVAILNGARHGEVLAIR